VIWLIGQWVVFEMLAAAIGLWTGWMLWGRGRRRAERRSQTELAALRAERTHLRRALEEAERRARLAEARARS
jgi:hypothetical protein